MEGPSRPYPGAAGLCQVLFHFLSWCGLRRKGQVYLTSCLSLGLLQSPMGTTWTSPRGHPHTCLCTYMYLPGNKPHNFQMKVKYTFRKRRSNNLHPSTYSSILTFDHSSTMATIYLDICVSSSSLEL